MKHLFFILCLPLTSLPLSSLAASQYVRGYFWWMTGKTYVQQNSSITNPQNAWKSTPVTFTANLAAGLKCIGWYRTSDLSAIRVSELSLVENGDPINSLTWTPEDPAPDVYLGLELDYINYTLVHDGVSSATLSYTNTATIAKYSKTRKGYTFASSWTNAAGTAFSVGQKVTGATFALANHDDTAVVKLYPKWTANAYTVKFDPDGGTCATASKGVTYDRTYGTLPVPTCAGKTFLGWYDASGSVVTASSLVQTDGDHTLTARWSANTYTITLKVNTSGDGVGSFDPASAISAHYGEDVTFAALANEDSRFEGWSDGETKAQRTITVESNAVYTALFNIRIYIVTFNWLTERGARTNESQTVRWGENAIPPTNLPTLPGYKKPYWDKGYLDVRENLIVTAVYDKESYYVSFATGGEGKGTLDAVSDFYDYGTKLTVTAKPGIGSAFEKWNDGETQAERQIIVTGAVEYCASFCLTTADVTFKWRVNEGIETQEVQKVKWQQDAVAPDRDVVNRYTGYDWTGWSPSTFTNITEDLEVEAVYQPHAYTVHFDANGGTGEMADQEFLYGVTQRLANCTFKNSNMPFSGWTNETAASFYADGALVSNLTAEAGGVVTLKAVWEVGDLSRAMGCDNLCWTSGVWKVVNEGHGSPTCASYSGANELNNMYAVLATNGVLRFDWKLSNKNQKLYVLIPDTVYQIAELSGSANVWQSSEIRIDMQLTPTITFPHEVTIVGVNGSGGVETASIDNMTWIPDGGNPEPTEEDRPQIDALAFTEEGLTIRISNASTAFDYQLLGTNVLTAPMPWPVVTNATGSAEGCLDFQIPREGTSAQMFYRARVMRKR